MHSKCANKIRERNRLMKKNEQEKSAHYINNPLSKSIILCFIGVPSANRLEHETGIIGFVQETRVGHTPGVYSSQVASDKTTRRPRGYALAAE